VSGEDVEITGSREVTKKKEEDWVSMRKIWRYWL
jgi:hypothetical protein